jgi:hypothetical protein
VAGELLVAGVKGGVVVARVGDPALEVVGDQDLRCPTQILQAAHLGADPVAQPLGPGGLDIGVTGGPEHGHEDLGLTLLPGVYVDDHDRLAAVVDEQPFPRGMALAQGDRQGSGKGAVVRAKATVRVAVRVTLPVLLPEQVQGDPGTAHLAMHRRPVGLRTPDLGRR